jgi:hypothetical protein
MKPVAVLVGLLLAGLVFSEATSADGSCKPFKYGGAAYLERCGDRIRSFSLKATDERWREMPGAHGIFVFECFDLISAEQLGLLLNFPDYVESQRARCPDEPKIAGSFIPLEEWQSSGKDENALLDAYHRNYWQTLYSLPKPTPTCPLFDVSFGGLAGRATCITFNGEGAVLAAFADDRAAFWVLLTQDGENLEALKKKSHITLANQFAVERGDGDATLLRWIK